MAAYHRNSGDMPSRQHAMYRTVSQASTVQHHSLCVSHGKPPDVSNLRVFGSPCFSYVEKQHRLSSNYHAHAEPGIFLGYDSCSPSYYVYIPARKCILTRHEVKCDEGFETGLDVLLGKYVKDVDEVVEFQAITSVPTQPRSTSSSDLDRLFKPSVSLGPSKRLNSQNNRKLLNHCTSKAAYIRNRCQAIHGNRCQAHGIPDI